MFWAVVVSMSMATAALFLYNNTMDYLNATVRANFYLKIHIIQVDHIRFEKSPFYF